MNGSRPSVVLRLTLLAISVAACGTPLVPTPAPVAEPAVEEPTVEPSAAASPPAASASEDTTVVLPGEAWIVFQGTGLELIRPDGTGRHRLYPMLASGEHLHPDWSPDGERIVFSIRVSRTPSASATSRVVLKSCIVASAEQRPSLPSPVAAVHGIRRGSLVLLDGGVHERRAERS